MSFLPLIFTCSYTDMLSALVKGTCSPQIGLQLVCLTQRTPAIMTHLRVVPWLCPVQSALHALSQEILGSVRLLLL